jgi:hypothetical protein
MKKYIYHILGLVLIIVLAVVFYHTERIETKFQDAKRFSENTAPVKVSDKYGFIDQEGHFIIEAQYDDAEPFTNGFAKIKVEKSWGIINVNNDIILEPIYDSINPYGLNYYLIETNGKKGLCDKNFDFIFEPFYTDIHIIDDEYYITRNNDSMEIFDSKGKKAISGTFQDIDVYQEKHMAYLKKNEKWAIYDLKNKEYTSNFDFDEIQYKYLDQHITIKDNKYGIIDDKGTILIENKYDYLETEDGKTYSYKENDLYGYLDLSGNIIIPAKYKNAKAFEEGLAKVYTEIDGVNYIGFINEDDETVIDFKYRLAHKKDSIIAVYENIDNAYKWGLIDTEGNTLIKARYDEIKFHGDKFIVMSDYKYGLLDKDYKTVVPVKYNEIKILGEKAIAISDKSLDIYDSKGNPEAHVEFDYFEMINYDLIKIRIGDNYGVVDMTGKMLVPTIYQDIKYGYLYKNYWIKYSDKWGLIDSDGNIILEPEYDDFKFSQNIYPVKIDQDWIYIDESGENVLEK